MYITAITKKDEGNKNKSKYLVRYMDSGSAEGLSEQFMRFYGLKEVMPGSYFYLGHVKTRGDYDWSGFQVQGLSN